MQTEKDLSKYRLELADEFLQDANLLFENNRYKSAANRSYYCIFHCIRSILALDNIDFKKHSAVIAYFRENYVKKGMFDKRMSDIITVLFRVRSKSDYDDYYLISKQDVREQLESAEYFLEQVKQYLKYTA